MTGGLITVHFCTNNIKHITVMDWARDNYSQNFNDQQKFCKKMWSAFIEMHDVARRDKITQLFLFLSHCQF